MEIVIKTILQQIVTQCAGTQDIIKKLASCDPCGRKSGLKTIVFLLRLSILSLVTDNNPSWISRSRMTVEIISWSISTKVWYWARDQTRDPGSAFRHVSAVRHVTDCATWLGIYVLVKKWENKLIIVFSYLEYQLFRKAYHGFQCFVGFGVLSFGVFVLFELVLFIPSTMFQLNRHASFWVVPVLS